MGIVQNFTDINSVNWIGNATSGTGGGAFSIEDSNRNVYSSQWESTTRTGWIMKRDSNGAFLWIRGLGTTFDATVGGNIALDSSNNVYIAGSCEATVNGDVNATALYLAKYDTDGNFQWGRQYADSNFWVKGFRIHVDSSNNMYVVGSNTQGIVRGWIVKFDASGNLLWQKLWSDLSGNAGATSFQAAATDSASNVYIVGQSQDAPGGVVSSATSGVIVKYNSSGTFQWKKTLYYNGSISVSFSNIVIDKNDNIFVTGSNSTSPQLGSTINKYNTSGVLQWQKHVNGTGGSNLWPGTYGLTVDDDSNIYIGTIYGGIVCLNSSGNLLWYNRLKQSNNFVFTGVHGLKYIKPNNLLIGTSTGDGAAAHMVLKVPKNGSKRYTFNTVGSYTIVYEAGSQQGTITSNTAAALEGTDTLTETVPTNSATSLSLNITITGVTANTTLI
jgi:hypothetical protein